MKKLESLNASAFPPMETNAMIQVKGGYKTGAGARAIEGTLMRFASDQIDPSDFGPILRAFDQKGQLVFELLDI